MSPVRLLAQEASADVDFGSGENLALFAIMGRLPVACWGAFVLVRQVLAPTRAPRRCARSPAPSRRAAAPT